MINDIMVALEKSTKQAVVTLLSSILFEMILFISKTVEIVDLSGLNPPWASFKIFFPPNTYKSWHEHISSTVFQVMVVGRRALNC